MIDSSQENPKSRQAVGGEALARFLEALSPDPKEAGLRYARLHKKLVGFFSLKGIPDPASAADETLDRAEHRHQMAGVMKTTVLALRMRVARLRKRLTDCVKNARINN